MVFTSISLAIGSIADTRTMGRISAKTLFWFLLCSFLALLLAGCVGYGTYSMGLFNTRIEGLAEASGSTGSNPLNVVLNIIPSNIITAFGSNGAVLSSVFLAVAIGLSMNTLGESRTATLRRLLGEVNDVVVVFLNFIVSNFAPFAVFVLLTRTFAIYGIDYLKPALVYVVVTVVLLLAFLIIAYPLVIALGAKLDPFTFIRKIANVAVFGFSTSSSAATLPLNIKVCEEEFGVDESIASFVLPLGMTINMDGTAIMQVIATVFIAGCAGYTVTPGQLVVVALLALLAGLCCKLPKVFSVVSRLALTAALAVGLCLNGGYLRGVVRTHHAENLAAYQFFVRTIEAGLADAVQSDDLILCNENVWDSNAEAESAFFSRFTGRALHAQVLWTENPATDGDAYAYQTYRNYGGYDLAWCGRLQSADSDLMDGVQVYVQSAYVPDNAVIKYKVRLADSTEEARAICLLDCTQTPRDRNGDYLATVEDTSIVNAKLMIWDG